MLKELLFDEAVTERADGAAVYVFDLKSGTIISLDDFMGGVRFVADYLEATETEETITMKADEEEEPPKWPKKKNIDTGKIAALKNAGWTQVSIAEEMGITPATVSRYVSELRDQGVIKD